MTDDELRASLPHREPKPEKPSPARPLSEIVMVTDEQALVWARKFGLIDADGMLHCGHCRQICDWHVGLQCATCRAEAPYRQRERERQEREARSRQAQEQSRPQQRVAGRSFRDEY